MTVLRADLLQGTVVALAGGVPCAVSDALVGAGAKVEALDQRLDETDAEEWARVRAPLRAVVLDARPAFGTGGPESLRAAVEQTWASLRPLATGALIPSSEGANIVLIAPSPDAGRYAEAARAALENLARTLSVEWARYALRTTAVLPGGQTSEDQLGELVCFLASSAGDYFSGCRLELGSVSPAESR